MTDWFERRAGELGAVEADASPDGPVMVLFGSDAPDWVKTPPELGPVRQLRVLDQFWGTCPKCKSGVVVRHLVVSEGFRVAECEHACGFVWYKLKENAK